MVMSSTCCPGGLGGTYTKNFLEGEAIISGMGTLLLYSPEVTGQSDERQVPRETAAAAQFFTPYMHRWDVVDLFGLN